MLEDALKGAIIGAICGLIIWLFRKYQEKRNGSESARETQTNQGSAQAFALLSVGGFMNDRLFPLYEKPICIGTDPLKCSIVYPKGTPGIAPLHCQVLPQNDGWLLVDFSDTGTWLGTERLRGGEPYVLQEGDRFYLSDAVNTFIFIVRR